MATGSDIMQKNCRKHTSTCPQGTADMSNYKEEEDELLHVSERNRVPSIYSNDYCIAESYTVSTWMM